MKKSIFIYLLFIGLSSHAQVVLSTIFSDNMVLQRNVTIPVWGTATANEKIEIRFNKQVKTTRADKKGKWILRLEEETAGGPYELIVKAKNTIHLKNILVGEVWICSGQSNMEWTVAQSDNAKKEIASANNPFIRHIKIPKNINSLPQENFKASPWQVCDSTTVGSFTGAGYFFAKNLFDELKIPIGLINSSWGGTNIETWISREAFQNSDEFKEMIATIPKVDLDSLSKLRVKGVLERIENVQGSKINSKNSNSFKDLSFDDTTWPELNEPQVWEQQSLATFDGIVWLRKTIFLSAKNIKEKAILELSKIDDNDITFFNGIKVGSTNQWDSPRKYEIPEGILKEGKNVISVRVVDNGGDGGIYGNPENLKLTLGNSIIPLNGIWKFQVESVKSEVNENEFPSLTYNAMINPLISYAFKGVLWYQGESNATRAYQYRKAFPLLINDWRKKWNQGNFPFYFVQLATFKTIGNSNEGCGWAELREAQSKTLQLPNTGMIVTTDIGNSSDIHPTNKQEVGRRLAAIALNNAYKKSKVCYGPSYKSMEINGNQINITFDNLGSGLFTTDKYGYIKGFEIAAKNQVFYFAKAYIKENKIVVYSENVENPIAVRFGWMGDISENNLFNKEGFPVMPFRTDEWEMITKDEKYKPQKL